MSFARIGFFCLIGSFTAFAAGCSSGGGGGNRGGFPTDGGTTMNKSDGGAGCSGAPGLMTCAGRCTDVEIDPANCGSCGHACAMGQLCQSGKCTTGNNCTGPGQMTCNGACVNILSDNNNCGACNNPCGQGQMCNSGQCSTNCNGTVCGGSCVDTNSDNNNCGACFNACNFPMTCQNGTCGCSNGQTNCSGTCVNTRTDTNNCGGCGRPCAQGQTCNNGICQGGGGGLNGCNGLLGCVNACMDNACAMTCGMGATQTAGIELDNLFCCVFGVSVLGHACNMAGACPARNNGICDSMAANYNDANCMSCAQSAQNQGGACYNTLQTCLNNKP